MSSKATQPYLSIHEHIFLDIIRIFPRWYFTEDMLERTNVKLCPSMPTLSLFQAWSSWREWGSVGWSGIHSHFLFQCHSRWPGCGIIINFIKGIYFRVWFFVRMFYNIYVESGHIVPVLIKLKREWGGFGWSCIKQSRPWKEASLAHSKDFVHGKPKFELK